MTCTKTGCHIYIEPYQEWAYGDAFELGPVAYFRIVQRSFTPLDRVQHYTVVNYDTWFDQDQTVSTLISDAFVNHGYDGIATQ